jgi:2-keto-4-pentenoate hydratase/2-oxohepta-3-ene-1,7-dioic acid hydratase in catechol pathway
MRIIRYLDASGKIGYAAEQADGSSHELEGDLFGELRPTGRAAVVAKRLAPLVPVNILAIGLNYRKHAEEGGKAVPERPMLFLKATSSLQNPGDPILLPTHLASHEVDFECELAVVIGRACKNVRKEDALDYVLGYTCANDVSARDWQNKWGGGQFCQGKSFDTFCPLGPAIVTRDEIPDPQALRMTTRINGEVMQDCGTDDMVFSVASLIEFLSGSKTLLPGTVILTGTPHGVGLGRRPPVWLKDGDLVTLEIEKIGQLSNPVAKEA